MNPQEHPEAYFLVFGGEQWGGPIAITGHDRNWKWDKKEAKGTTGATNTLVGQSLCEFEVAFQLAKDFSTGWDGFEEWEKFQKILESAVAGTTAKALPIYHPDLARNRIKAASVVSIGGMLHDGKGGATVKVKFTEYNPPKKKPAQKATPAGAASKAQKVDPNAARKRELAALIEQAKRL